MKQSQSCIVYITLLLNNFWHGTRISQQSVSPGQGRGNQNEEEIKLCRCKLWEWPGLFVCLYKPP